MKILYNDDKVDDTMKRIKFMLFGLLFLLNICLVSAKSETLDSFKNIDIEVAGVNNIIGYKDGYILTEDNNGTIFYSYSNDMELESTKTLEDLSKAKVINFGDCFLVVGVSSNTLKSYLLDSNLKVLKQKDTSYFIQESSEINLYSYENKIYVMLTYDENLISSSIYEIDNELEIKENKFSSYNADNLKKILKSDYYLIHNNDKEDNGRITHYNSSTYLNDKSILVGTTSNLSYDEVLGMDEKAVITIFDNKGNIVSELVNDEYTSFKDVLIVKDKIVALGSKSQSYENVLIIFDSTGKVLEVIMLDNTNESLSLKKLSNRVILLDENKMYSYSFDVNIYKEEDTFGSIDFNSVVSPYDIVKINVVPNSGYKVKDILVRDSQGNRISVVNNEFVMPSNDVFISVNYEELVTNPETLDIITIVVPVLFIGIIVFYRLYKKMIWLK